jgi:hypothetical protein
LVMGNTGYRLRMVLIPGHAAHGFRDDGAPLFRDIVAHRFR